MAQDANETDEIRRQMAQIRLTLHQGVQQVVAGAGDVADWRRYVRMYPWAAVGAAAVAGYLIVPSRRSAPTVIVQRPDSVPEPQPQPEPGRASLVGAAVGLLAPMVWRVAQNYAVYTIEQWIAAQQERTRASAGPPTGGVSSSSSPWGN